MFRIALASVLFSATAALAEVPRVVTDILPVQGIVAGVMDGIGEPAAILPPGADPHGYAMRPSDAAALEDADIVFWIGEDLTPWLAKPIGTLAGNAVSIELLDVDGTRLIEIEERDGNDDHRHEGHGHSGIDPHAWLDPDNAVVWLDAIAETLAEADPDNAVRYRENAADITEMIRAETANLEDRMAKLDAFPYAVHHDAYRYFETRFGLSHAFAVIPADGQEPGPRRMADIRQMAQDAEVARLIVDTGWDVKNLAATIFGPRSARICTFDLLGSQVEPGASYFPDFLNGLADDMQACLGP